MVLVFPIGEVAKAVSLLPDLPMQIEEPTAPSLERAGVGANSERRFAPEFAPLAVNDGQKVTNHDNLPASAGNKNADSAIDVKSYPDTRKGPLTTPVNCPFEVGDTGLEPVTPSLSSRCPDRT